MVRFLCHVAICVLTLLNPTSAGFPAQPEGVTTIQSRFGDGVEISYKEVICPSES